TTSWACWKVLQGAASVQGLPSLPCAATNTRAGCACAGPLHSAAAVGRIAMAIAGAENRACWFIATSRSRSRTPAQGRRRVLLLGDRGERSGVGAVAADGVVAEAPERR